MAELREIGQTGIRVPRIGFGSTGLGSIPEIYGYEVDENRAIGTIKAILSQPNAFLDTSRCYAMGRSEERIGKVIRELGGWPGGRVLSTKIDRNLETGAFDASQARKSFEESLRALGVDRVDILHIHDVEYASDLSEVKESGGAIEELFRIKDEGLAKAVGIAAGRVDLMMPILEGWDFDVVLTHNRHTLVNNNAAPLIEFAKSRGCSILNAAPFSGGVLARGSAIHRFYVYRPADDDILAPIRAVEEICGHYDVPVGAAALQYSLKDEDITSTICGVTWPQHVQQAMEWAEWSIPEGVWEELAELDKTSSDPEA
ncbi:aldo/keto reductase [Ruegeria sp. HKCCA5426]|uniref:aldo/keto reductase n=1 Tax=Ruegeria sp. HKCCA5426 TaxID=2682985 RepID=UPI001488D225|nr:aldo/keto reductase [Ruegeria sp. HKCCA5426]